LANPIRSAGLIPVILGIGFLRTLVPVPGLALAWNHPLSLGLLLLFVVWVAVRSDGGRLVSAPLVAALLIEGWVRLAFFNPAFERWLTPHLPGRLADSVYHLLGAAWLGAIVLIFARPAGSPLGARLSPRRWKGGLYLHTLSVLFVYGLLAGLLEAFIGFRGLSIKVPIYPPVALWMLAGQAALCAGEEIFYRGFLMGALDAVLGARRARAGTLALWLSSAVFAFDHLRGMSWGLPLLMTGLYTFGLGVLLAVLMRLTGNLPLVVLAHLFHNLMILRLGLAVSDLSGDILFEAGTYIALYFIATFGILFFLRRPACEPLRRTLVGVA